MNASNLSKKHILGLFIGFLAVSLAFNAAIHFTVGEETCELSESLEANNNSQLGNILSSENACPTFSERWVASISRGPLYQPFFYFFSCLGGIVGLGVSYFMEERER